MNNTYYPTWRVRVLHWVAKALGVLIHIEGFPYGSLRLYQIDYDPCNVQATDSTCFECAQPPCQVADSMRHRSR